MNKIHSVLLKIAAACMVALGSGFVALTPHYLHYDKNAYEALYKLEEKIGAIKDVKNYDCNITGKHRADCKIAQHLIETNGSILELANVLKSALLTIALFSTLLSIGFSIANYIDATDNSSENPAP